MGARNGGWLVLYLLFLYFSLIVRLSVGASRGTLSVGQFISEGQTIISEGDGNFELGLFVTDYGSWNWRFGIWYRNTRYATIAWVANRDEAVGDFNSKLKLLEDGNLVIIDSSNTVIWSTNLTSTSSNSTEAALLDSGNLVLRDVSNTSNLIWESFDHPTDTWLPGGKIGLNKLTNESQRLTTWKNFDDPSTGFSSLEIDPAGSSQLFFLYNGFLKFNLSIGTWNGHVFSLVPEMSGNNNFNFTYVSNQKENYFTYTLYNSSILSRIVIDVSQINLFTFDLDDNNWNLTYVWKRPCEVCGAFAICNTYALCECLPGFKQSDVFGGCVRNTPLQCALNKASVNGEEDGFLMLPNMILPKNPQCDCGAEAHCGAGACESACLNSCSCQAFAYASDACGGCSMWEGDLLNMEQLSEFDDPRAQNLFVKLAASDNWNLTSGGNKKKGSTTSAIVGAASGVVALLSLTLVLIWTTQRRILVGPSEAIEHFLVSFSYKDLHIVTGKFSQKLGGGGFGSVFRGTLPDSSVVAVKKLEGFSQGEKQFRAEVSTVGVIQHVNLVRLRGFCCEGTKRLLVYDFMPKGSLDSHLFRVKKDSQILDWKTRYQIALGTARGLAYLHEECRECIIHCDIKPENILLDDEFCPKVADFGLAKLVGRDFSRVLTTMRGTIGYLAPEWISGVAITAKADVYSYGMMLFELISGRRNSNQSNGQKVGFFPIWAARKINEDGEILSLLDDRLEGNVDLAELNRACKIACWCIQDEGVHRPSMGLVVQILEGLVEVNTPPIPRILQALVDNDEDVVLLSEPSSKQSNQARSPTSGTSSQATSSTNSMT